MRAHLAGGGIDRGGHASSARPRRRRANCGWSARHERLGALFVRDIRIAIRIGGGALIGVLFFMSVVTLMPFAIGPDLALLQRIGPAILWLGALLASLLALDRLLAADQEDGSLDLLTDGPAPLELAVGVKALAHWLTTALAAGDRRRRCCAFTQSRSGRDRPR